MRRIAITAVSVLGATFALAANAVPSFAANATPGQHTSSVTTLDACGYFVATQTANKTSDTGTLYSEKGTWTGVDNNYGGGPVASLGDVKGSYAESYDYSSNGDITNGTEVFRSNAGEITQTFQFVNGTWSVSVTATRSLAFLTSDTNGQCYTGPFPRP